MAKIIVGIDFGTSTTVVRWRREDSDEVNAIKDANGQSLVIDTAIYIPQDSDNWIYGKQALIQGNRKGILVRNFKMDLINPETEEQAKKYIRKFMEYVYSLFVKQTVGVNYDLMDIYISYPVKWSTEKKMLMKNIISEAGFGKHGQIIGKTEPVAAAAELMRIHIPHLISGKVLKVNNPLNVLMLDMGAGTSDLFLFQLTLAANGEVNIPEDKIVQYPVAKQPYNCGGREIDEILSKEILSYLSIGMGRQAKEQWFDPKKAKEWKDSTISTVLIGKDQTGPYIVEAPSHIMPLIEMSIDEGQWNNTIGEYKMSRSKFEAITESHWSNLYKLIENGMAKFKQECKVGAEDVDIIFLTGGHSQWYCVPKLFNGGGINGTVAVDTPKHKALNFSKIIGNEWKILQGVNPQETVANGLCWPGSIYIPTKADNNVWIRFGVNGTFSQYKQIIEIGDLLPKQKYIGKKQDENSEEDCSEDEYSINLDKHVIFDSGEFHIIFEILEGQSIETATLSKFSYENNTDLPVLVKVLLATIPIIGTILFFQKEQRKFAYNAHVGLMEDGTLSISGQFEVNGNKQVEFTQKDFKVS